MIENIPFFLVTGDVKIENFLRGIIGKLHPKAKIFYARDGAYAWEFIQKQNFPIIVVMDEIIPKMSAMKFIKNIRSVDELDDKYLIIITEKGNKEVNLKAMQGGADDFLSKPFAVDELYGKFRTANNYISISKNVWSERQVVKELNEKIANDAEKIRDLLIKMQDVRLPEYKQLIRGVAKKAVWIAKELDGSNMDQLSTKEIDEIESAAKLCLIGKLNLPDKTIYSPVMSNGHVRNRAMESVPVFAVELADQIRGYSNVSNILKHIYENFDGSGIPEKIQSWQIPLGSRIIRAVLDFEELMVKVKNHDKAYNALEHEAHRLYDYRIVTFLDQFFAVHGAHSGKDYREKAINQKDLQSGDVLTRNIITQSGLKLMASSTVLDPSKIQKIQSIIAEDPAIGRIYIKA